MRVALLATVLLVGMISTVFAQTTQTKVLIGSGGAHSAAGNVTLTSNVGEPIAGYGKEAPHINWAGFYGSYLNQLVGVDNEPRITFISFLGKVTPNPIRASAVIEFGNALRQSVELSLYDVAGRRVRKLYAGDLHAGVFQIPWDLRSDQGSAVDAGVYFVRLATRDFQRSDRVVVVR